MRDKEREINRHFAIRNMMGSFLYYAHLQDSFPLPFLVKKVAMRRGMLNYSLHATYNRHLKGFSQMHLEIILGHDIEKD